MNERPPTYFIRSPMTKDVVTAANALAGRRRSRLSLRLKCLALIAWMGVLLNLVSATTLAANEEPVRPNILWISCEDISSHLGCYGAQDARTPNIDALAAQGIRFTHTFTTCPVCATNRSSIITGMYPTTIGTHLMRCSAKLPAHIKCFTEYLREAGYYCTNDAKTDYNFRHDKAAWDANEGGSHWRHRPKGKPFFHVRNFGNTHESRIWPRGEAHLRQTPHLKQADRRDPTTLTLPPYYPDTEETRRDWANYHENITELDYRVEKLLRELDEDGLTDDTIIFFWSDHGVGLPRGKRWLYDSGTRVPLMVVVPEKFRQAGQASPGSVSEELLSFIDLAPTVLNLAGVAVPDHMQGRAFLGEGRGAKRDFIVSTRDRMDERYDIIRTVRIGNWRYTRNYMPWKPYAQWLNYAEINKTMQGLRRLKAAGTLPRAAQLFMSDRKPIEELYQTDADPHEINNLAQSADAEHQAILKKMRATLARWQEETHDLGFIPEPELTAGEQALGSRYGILNSADAKGRVARLRSMITAATSGDDKLLAQGLLSSDPAERYWAVVGIGRKLIEGTIDGETFPAASLLSSMQKAALDDRVVVRIAAAENLCYLDADEEGLAILTASLTNEDPWARLAAATALDELGERALPAVDRIKRALESDQQGYYRAAIGRALAVLETEQE